MQHQTAIGYVGHAPEWDREVVHGELDSLDFVAHYIRNGKLVAAAAAGSHGPQLAAWAELSGLDRLPPAARIERGPFDLWSVLT
jgi:hypothetical protein